ncbi:MAG: DNA protecting protein DprA [Candidatus Levybacteria bacterium RIFCSPHIGHO2_01_FULL_40_10]|nr:MAG: DNA protecting protein DprA [Candidatus Levybacteria bacterium RIFCSPHIGHO2_01_FULL_40_10]
MDENLYILAFSNAPAVGAITFQKLLKIFGSAEKAWKAGSNELKKVGLGEKKYTAFDQFRKQFNVSEYIQKLKKAKVEFIAFGSKDYPESLKKLKDPPIGLFVKGNKDLLFVGQNIGVVGARKITSYGKQVTENIVSELVRETIVITSGMALGVDGIAHKTAIEHKGSTIAVLGCGVDCPYPRENERLYESILDSNGLIISEYPLGMPANQGTFPARNRIIAGLSIAVLITEAAEDSGSLITADHAIKQGKTVFAIPGPITSMMSKGALKLLKQGAKLAQSAQDILDELNIKNTQSKSGDRKKMDLPNLTKDEKKVFDVLNKEEMTMDELVRATKIPISKLSTLLSEMELEGILIGSRGKFTIKS